MSTKGPRTREGTLRQKRFCTAEESVHMHSLEGVWLIKMPQLPGNCNILFFLSARVMQYSSAPLVPHYSTMLKTFLLLSACLVLLKMVCMCHFINQPHSSIQEANQTISDQQLHLPATLQAELLPGLQEWTGISTVMDRKEA